MGNPASFVTAASIEDVNTFTAAQTFAPAVMASGARTALTVTGAADTGVTASTEQSDVYVNLARTVTWATGALTNQRAVRIAAPTLAFAGASTVTNAATLYVDRAPQAGTNATITNAYALWVDAGASRLDGTLLVNDAASVVIDDATNNGVTRGLTLSHTTSGTASAGIGAGVLLRAESGAGTLRSAGAIDAIHTTATDGAEVSALVLSAAMAGTLVEGARVTSPASAVNSVLLTGSATGNAVALSVFGSDTNVGINASPKGTGSLSLKSGGGTTRIEINNTGMGFFGATPAEQPTAVADAAGGVTQDAEARTALNNLLARLRTLGIIAT